jgi:hypothetical protein
MTRDATGLAGARHIEFETLGSTNAEALALARAGERGPLWITAKTQSAGRGRRGSAWVSLPGNLYATLLLTEPSAPPEAPQLSFVAALALHDAVSLMAPHLKPLLKVKWPNDLLHGVKKLAGILIEGESEPVFAAAVGVGVNCVSHPSATVYPATDLAAAGAHVSYSLYSPPRCNSVFANGSAGRALPRCVPTGSGAPPASASLSACGCRSESLPVASRVSMRSAACWSMDRTALRVSRPAKFLGW